MLNETTRALADQRKQQLTFIAGVAHDLRNPLSGLKITVDLLHELEPSLASRESGARALGVLRRNIDRLTRMVDDLLDTSRIEAGGVALCFEDGVDLREAARSAVELYGGTSPRHAVRLEVPEAPVTIRADPTRLDQVVGNLVSNAIKYSPEGGDIVVRVEKRGADAILAVCDRGVGIPPEEHARIFEPFRRAGRAADLAPGAGLGLSVVRRIVEAHGGHVELQSAPERGSEFRIVLPSSSEPSEE